MLISPPENLDSQVNGSATVFTLSNNIAVINYIIFDGAPYIGTFNVTASNQITLADAPESTLRVSYYNTTPTGATQFLTVSEAIDRLQRQYNDSVGEVSNELYFDWLSDLNFMIYRILYKNDPSFYINEVSYTISSGNPTYSLPSDFKDMKVSGCGIFINNQSNVPPQKLVESKYGSADSGFYLLGNNFHITPTPSDSGTVTMRYVPRILPITTINDNLVINFEHFKMLIDYLDREYRQWNLESIREQAADIRFQRQIEMLFSDTYRLPKIYRFR